VSMALVYCGLAVIAVPDAATDAAVVAVLARGAFMFQVVDEPGCAWVVCQVAVAEVAVATVGTEPEVVIVRTVFGVLQLLVDWAMGQQVVKAGQHEFMRWRHQQQW
jgi:hypothetical protein